MVRKKYSGIVLANFLGILIFLLFVVRAQADEPCPVNVSTNRDISVSVASTPNCSVYISSGATLSVPGVAILAGGAGSTVVNDGTISGISGMRNSTPGIGTFTNSSSGVITTTSISIFNSNSSIATFNNYGSISSNNDSFTNRGNITNLINTGSIKGGNVAGGAGSAIVNGSDSLSGSITNLTNTGALSSGGTGYGIYNYLGRGSVSNLNNGQGGNGATPSTTALKHWGPLPTNYNIIVTSTSKYGQLAVFSPSSSTIFGIYSGGVSGIAASTLTPGTYTDVFTGLDVINLNGATSGTYGSLYNWSLSNRTGRSWDLIVTCISTCGSDNSNNNSNNNNSNSNSNNNNSNSNSNSNSSSTTNITTGSTVSLNAVGVAANPVLAGGTLVLTKGERSSQALSILSEGGIISAPTAGAAQLLGQLSGSGRVTFNGSGMTVLSGVNTYTGGTTVESGTLSLLGGTLGSGDVYVAPGAQLVGTGTIPGPVTVAGLFKPGNSPGYINANANVVMTNGSVYQQDIAGTTQASQSSPVGATGYYSYLNITGGQFIINPGSTLTPALSNLFNTEESGYGSTPYTPVIGDRFRIITADGGISGKFSTLTQPAELLSDRQFLPFYNLDGTNSLDLAVIPKSYVSTIAVNSGNQNAQSVGAALDQMVTATQSGTSDSAQDQLLYAGSTQSASNLVSYAQSLAGEVYAAAVAVIAQTTQRVQQAVLTRMGDTMGIGLPNALTLPAGNTALMGASHAALSGGVPSSAVSTNPDVNPNAEAKRFANGNVWGDLVYQKGHRTSDNYSGGWNSNLYQLVFGSDFLTTHGMTVGGGLALSNTTLNPTYGSGTIQQGAVFAYGKLPVQEYIVDAMASFGLNSSDLSRGDVTGLSNGFKNKSISGQDAMISLGVSRPVDIEHVRITPYARVTWQVVLQSGVNEGSAASALSVNSFTGNGVRGVIGIAAGSKANSPMTNPYTYRAYVGVGADSSGVLNPTLNASIAGINTTMTTPHAGATFVQAGLYGTAKIADNAYAYLGLSGEARSGQTLGAVNLGIRVQF